MAKQKKTEPKTLKRPPKQPAVIAGPGTDGGWDLSEVDDEHLMAELIRRSYVVVRKDKIISELASTAIPASRLKELGSTPEAKAAVNPHRSRHA